MLHPRETLTLHALTREPAGAPGGLKVVAADGAIEIEDFARQEQSWRQLALHVAESTSSSDTPPAVTSAFLKPSEPVIGMAVPLRRMTMRVIGSGQLGKAPLERYAREFHNGFDEPPRRPLGEEVDDGLLAGRRCLGCEAFHQFSLSHRRQKVARRLPRGHVRASVITRLRSMTTGPERPKCVNRNDTAPLSHWFGSRFGNRNRDVANGHAAQLVHPRRRRQKRHERRPRRHDRVAQPLAQA